MRETAIFRYTAFDERLRNMLFAWGCYQKKLAILLARMIELYFNNSMAQIGRHTVGTNIEVAFYKSFATQLNCPKIYSEFSSV